MLMVFSSTIEKTFACVFVCVHARGYYEQHVTGSVVKVEACLEVSRVYRSPLLIQLAPKKLFNRRFLLICLTLLYIV